MVSSLGQVVISEFMSSNSNTRHDGSGEYEDWIELHNRGATPVDLEGYGLTDNPSIPFKWKFAPAIIEPGGYLLVWASGGDRQARASVQGLLREVYHGISGTSIADLTGSGRVGGVPDFTEVLTSVFEAPANIGVDYGQRVSGVLAPTVTGEYRFWIASDDHGELYLSTDEDSANGTRIAHVPGWTGQREWEKYPTQQSAPVTLEAGKRYHLFALMKDGGGGNHLSAGWQRTGDAPERPMPASPFTTVPSDPHSNFSISASGEALQLTLPDGSVADTAPATALPRDVSYGRSADDLQIWVYFREGTPGAANATTSYGEIVWEAPTFSQSGGYFSDEFQLQLTGHPGATILYTLDGSIPDPANIGGATYSYKDYYPQSPGQSPGPLLAGTFETLTYSEPLTIRDRSGDPNKISNRNTTYRNSASGHTQSGPVFKGTVVRSRLAKTGAIPGPVITHTFFVGPDVATRYQLPVLSLSMDEDTLFDHFEGIYNAGVDFDNWRAGSNDDAFGFSPANYRRRGEEAERPVHLEIFQPGEGRAFAQNLGLRIHGGWSRAFPQKSIRLYAKNRYDDEAEINHPLIPGLADRSGDPIESFRRIILRNSGSDNYETRFRDAFIQELSRPLGFDTQAWQPAVHFVNGEYWGHVNLRESIDRFFISSHHGINPDHIAILTNNAEVTEGSLEDRNHYVSLRSYVQNHSMADPVHLAEVETRMDIRNYLLYCVAQIYANNTDWPHPNIEFWRSNQIGSSPTADGRWRWIIYDTDFGFGFNGDHTTNTLDHALNGADWARILIVRLLDNPGLRDAFINAFADHMATSFHPSRAVSLANEMRDTLAPYMGEHRARWRSSGGQSSHTDVLIKFAENRPQAMREHLISRYGLDPGDAYVTLDMGGTRGGHFVINSVTLNKDPPGIANAANPFPWTANYFRGVPVTVTAVAETGHRFVGWLQHPDHTSETITLDPASGIQLTALFEEVEIPEPPVLLHCWDFTSGSATAPSQTIGGAQLSVAFGPQTAIPVNAPSQGFDSDHLRINFPIGATLELTLPTVGHQEIRLSYDTRRSGNGAGEQILSYTTDGSTWTPFESYRVEAEDPQPRVFDFSEVPDVSDNLRFAVRIQFSQGVGGDEGNNRFDHISLQGTPLPEVPKGFAAWQLAEFPDPLDRTNPEVSGPLADPFQVGFPNLLRDALDLEDPDDAPDRLPRLGLHGSPALPWFHFPLNPEHTDVAWIIEASENLQSWNDILFDSREDIPSMTSENGWISVPDSSVTNRRFYRLRVIQIGD